MLVDVTACGTAGLLAWQLIEGGRLLAEPVRPPGSEPSSIYARAHENVPIRTLWRKA
jgi:hypothetical protein